MRYVRMLLVALLAIILVGVALANRQLVTVSLFPGRLDRYMGGDWQVQMPLFLVIILALLAGMVLGLVWILPLLPLILWMEKPDPEGP